MPQFVGNNFCFQQIDVNKLLNVYKSVKCIFLLNLNGIFYRLKIRLMCIFNQIVNIVVKN